MFFTNSCLGFLFFKDFLGELHDQNEEFPIPFFFLTFLGDLLLYLSFALLT